MIKYFSIIFLLTAFFSAVAAEKVVSLSPAVTELIIYAGGADRLCGRSRACEIIPQVRHLPVAGDLGKPFAEAVLRSGATLVVSDARHPAAGWDVLRRCGVKVEILPAEKLDDLPGNLRKIGSRLDCPAAEPLADGIEKKLGDLRNSVPGKKFRGLIVFGTAPLIACGQETFISDAARLAGVENIAGNAGTGYFILSPEFLISAAPEVILIIGVPKAAVKEFFSRELYRNIPAVRSGRIIVLDREKWSRLTPVILDASRELRQQLSGKPHDQLP